MSGRRKHAQRAFGCPLDGRVGPRFGEQRAWIAFRWESVPRCAARAHGRRLNWPCPWCCATAQDRRGSVRNDDASFFGFDAARIVRWPPMDGQPAKTWPQACATEQPRSACGSLHLAGSTGSATNGRPACMVKLKAGQGRRTNPKRPRQPAFLCLARERKQRNE